MPRKKIESVSGNLLEDFPVVGEPESMKPLAEEESHASLSHAKEVLEPLLAETFETDKYVKRNKELKDQIKSLLIDDLNLVEVECDCGTAKISESVGTSLDEEGLISDLKGVGREDLVKSKTIYYVDMEALEKAVYDEDGTDDTTITDLVKSRTTETVTKRLLVKAAKPKKEKGGK